VLLAGLYAFFALAFVRWDRSVAPAGAAESTPTAA
jgi:hypothetical protein